MLGKERKTLVFTPLMYGSARNETHVNLDIYVTKCPVKSERKPLVLTLGFGFVLLVVVCLTFLFGLG